MKKRAERENEDDSGRVSLKSVSHGVSPSKLEFHLGSQFHDQYIPRRIFRSLRSPADAVQSSLRERLWTALISTTSGTPNGQKPKRLGRRVR